MSQVSMAERELGRQFYQTVCNPRIYSMMAGVFCLWESAIFAGPIVDMLDDPSLHLVGRIFGNACLTDDASLHVHDRSGASNATMSPALSTTKSKPLLLTVLPSSNTGKADEDVARQSATMPKTTTLPPPSTGNNKTNVCDGYVHNKSEFIMSMFDTILQGVAAVFLIFGLYETRVTKMKLWAMNFWRMAAMQHMLLVTILVCWDLITATRGMAFNVHEFAWYRFILLALHAYFYVVVSFYCRQLKIHRIVTPSRPDEAVYLDSDLSASMLAENVNAVLHAVSTRSGRPAYYLADRHSASRIRSNSTPPPPYVDVVANGTADAATTGTRDSYCSGTDTEHAACHNSAVAASRRSGALQIVALPPDRSRPHGRAVIVTATRRGHRSRRTRNGSHRTCHRGQLACHHARHREQCWVSGQPIHHGHHSHHGTRHRSAEPAPGRDVSFEMFTVERPREPEPVQTPEGDTAAPNESNVAPAAQQLDTNTAPPPLPVDEITPSNTATSQPALHPKEATPAVYPSGICQLENIVRKAPSATVSDVKDDDLSVFGRDPQIHAPFRDVLNRAASTSSSDTFAIATPGPGSSCPARDERETWIGSKHFINPR